MTRKKRDTSRKRASILDAATQAFVQFGFDNTSMDRIAEMAVASKRTVYNHFPSKEILFEAVLDRFLRESERLKSIPYDADKPLEAQLEAFIDAKLAVIENASWLGLVRVALSVHMRDTQLAGEAFALYESGDDALVDWLSAAETDGRLQVEDAEMAASVFWSMVSGALSWPQIFAGPMASARVSAFKKEMIETFLARYGV